jgi:hypothetical protein
VISNCGKIKIWKEAIVVYLQALACIHLKIEENNYKPQSGKAG